LIQDNLTIGAEVCHPPAERYVAAGAVGRYLDVLAAVSIPTEQTGLTLEENVAG
jgi:hypothetical protein